MVVIAILVEVIVVMYVGKRDMIRKLKDILYKTVVRQYGVRNAIKVVTERSNVTADTV